VVAEAVDQQIHKELLVAQPLLTEVVALVQALHHLHLMALQVLLIEVVVAVLVEVEVQIIQLVAQEAQVSL
jgi:ABC-type transport system involved in cytochrome c biogenesis permease component